MGKTTNALEGILRSWHAADGHTAALIAASRAFHADILQALFPNPGHPVYEKVAGYFRQLETCVAAPPVAAAFNFDYDRIVSLGEFISTTIVGEYLRLRDLPVHWFDVRELILTDTSWREGNVNWALTEKAVRTKVLPLLAGRQGLVVALTQGFVGGTETGLTTTLGREGSDYTAAIFSYILDADRMVVWKDVEGIRNADPKLFADTILLPHISYGEAIELTYYGATVIHPKTIKPLQNKHIPLHVRSFLQPEREGTIITLASDTDTAVPSFIVKGDQLLVSISPKDFSFIAEQNLSEIFAAFARSGIRINMMQNSAISFTACFTADEQKTQRLFELLSREFTIKYNAGLQLITIRHWTPEAIERMTQHKTILLEQRNRTTVQIIV
jgi:aspartate kinase